MAHRRPGVVGQLHPHQHVAGQHAAGDGLSGVVAHFDDLFGGDDRLKDVVLHVQGCGPGVEVLLDPILHTRIGVDDVPFAELGFQFLPELRDGLGGGVVGFGLFGFVILRFVGEGDLFLGLVLLVERAEVDLDLVAGGGKLPQVDLEVVGVLTHWGFLQTG